MNNPMPKTENTNKRKSPPHLFALMRGPPDLRTENFFFARLPSALQHQCFFYALLSRILSCNNLIYGSLKIRKIP